MDGQGQLSRGAALHGGVCKCLRGMMTSTQEEPQFQKYVFDFVCVFKV